MQIKRIYFLIFGLFLTSPVIAQSSNQETKCEDNLVTTFAKYFYKSEVKIDTNKTNKSNKQSFTSKIYQSTIDNIISVGKTFLGIPYRWGGTRENGFDCSGFIKYIFDWFNIQLPRTSREMAHFGEYVSKNELQKGDLVFFSGRNASSGVIGHIGIVVEVTNEAIKLMHSSSSKGVHIEDLNTSEYLSRRYITARRLPIEDNKNNKN